MTFDSTPGSIPSVLGYSYGSLSFAPNIVSATNSAHTVTANIPLAVGDFIKLVYYP
jgi:hypothetical protein